MNNYYTYAYLREDGTPYYIGKGKGKRAYKKTKRDSIKPPKDRSRIIKLKQNLTEEEAFKHEKYMIFVFGRKDLGVGVLYNMTDGGEGTLGVKITPEFREKMRMIVTGRKHTEEAKEKISKSNKGKSSWIKGKTHSEETKEKLSNSLKGRKVSEEARRSISKAQTGEKNTFYGKKHTEETRNKMSDSQRKVNRSGENNPMTKHTPEAKEKMRLAWERRRAKIREKTTNPE